MDVLSLGLVVVVSLGFALGVVVELFSVAELEEWFLTLIYGLFAWVLLLLTSAFWLSGIRVMFIAVRSSVAMI